MARRNGQLSTLTVYTSAFGISQVTFGRTFCQTYGDARRRARLEAQGLVKELFLPLLGSFVDAKKKIWVGMPEIVRVVDIGMPEEDRLALTHGKDGVVFMKWMEDAMEPLLAASDDKSVGFVHIYED